MYVKNCKFCFRVVISEEINYNSVCRECNDHLYSHGQEYDSTVRLRYEPLTQMLWSVFSQYQIHTDATLDGVVDKHGHQIVFDYVIPECRLAIDIVADDQTYLNLGLGGSYELSKGSENKIATDHAREERTRQTNYRWATLPEDPNDARNKLLDLLNEVYVKETDGKVHVLTPRLQGDAGYDLVCDEDTMCLPGVGTDIPSQVYLEIPNHMYAIVQARSSTSKKRLLVLPGTIDSSYRGQIFTMMFNPTAESVLVKKGDRVSQLLFFCRMPHLHLNTVPELRPSERASRGFGSTGT